jgi:hypothetical protein
MMSKEERRNELNDSNGSDVEMLKAAGYVLQEAVERLMATWHLDDYKHKNDEYLEVQIEQGYAPEIQEEAEAVLLARNALRMTGYLFPRNSKRTDASR